MAEEAQVKNSVYKSIGFRLFIICVLILCLNIPLGMVKDVMYSRLNMFDTAMHDIASAWGGSQTIAAPIITVPAKYMKVSSVWNNQKKVSEQIETEQEEYIHILPENLNVTAEIFPEIRHRGIFEVLVYKTNLKIDGNFEALDKTKIDSKYKPLWDKAFFSLGLDPSAIRGEPHVLFNNNQLELNPGSGIKNLNGVSVPVDLKAVTTNQQAFNIDLQFNGSGTLSFAPIGKMNNFKIVSSWPHPTFSGTFRPDNPKISETGFDADWKIPSIARDYPQVFAGDSNINNINRKVASLTLYETMPIYKKSLRLADYGIMFICLTFVMMFLFERRLKQKLHYAQYVIVGLAISLFFLTVISFSEYINFALAYAIASLLVITMISFYIYGALRDKKTAFAGGALMAFLYTVLYLMLSEADYALLIGTIILLLTLGAIMWATRNINLSDD